MNECWKFVYESWPWLVLLACAGGAQWVAGHFDASLGAAGRRRARKFERREELHLLELEARRRELETAHPLPAAPVCGCGHDLAFHNIQTSACRHPAGDNECACQRYTGPERLGQVYLPLLADQERGVV